MTAPRRSLSWTLAAALLAAGCVERATNVQSHNRPSPVADTGVAPPGLSPSTLRRLGYDGDGSIGQPLRLPVRACDEQCLRNRGTPLLHLLRLAHRGPDRMRRILVAIDMPYARLWMAWLALATSDEEEARATLAEARSELRSPEHQARYRRALTAMGAGASPTLEQEIVAEMRAQLDGWSALDDELGREMAAVLPCAQFAPRGASTALAFRPLGDARSDDDALRFVERCANREIDALAMDGGTSAARDAIRALGDGVLSLVTAADAAVDPALDARVRTRIVEPFFVPSFQDPPVPDRAVLDGAAARDPATRAAVTAWLRARTAHLDTFARALCAKLTAAEPRTTVAQCRVRATSAINASALAVLGPAPR
ncbi:MAG: hypothetical protein JNK05_05790 [Myxococcales bacterium]|nr:hypothetical protein [Myxococcales bacterium]